MDADCSPRDQNSDGNMSPRQLQPRNGRTATCRLRGHAGRDEALPSTYTAAQLSIRIRNQLEQILVHEVHSSLIPKPPKLEMTNALGSSRQWCVTRP